MLFILFSCEKMASKNIISVSAREVIIMDEYGQRLRDIVGPYNEGAHLTLFCEAEGGKKFTSSYSF